MSPLKLTGFDEEGGIHIPEFGSLIGNWGKRIFSDFEIARANPRI